MRLRAAVALVLFGAACFPAATPQRGAAGVQEGPEEGPLRPSEPIGRAPGGPSGAPVTAQAPPGGVHAAPAPQPGPVPVWPTMEFEPQGPIRTASATAPRPPGPSGSGRRRPGSGRIPTLEVAAVDEPARRGPEDVVEPSYGPAPDGGVAGEYPADARTRDEVRAGMESVRQRLLRCFPEGRLPGGILTVTVLIQPEGVVDAVSVQEPVSEAQFDCVEAAMMQATFRRVHGDPLRVLYPYAQSDDDV